MPAGSVVIIAGKTYHSAGANVTDRPRLGMNVDYSKCARPFRRRDPA